ncbi:MAG TPA: transporter substrate-binding domain-containing protein [Rhodospirillales bacterium]|nr:transporter substrate-binding domain-containing protein [Rhodospirillales bacterium]
MVLSVLLGSSAGDAAARPLDEVTQAGALRVAVYRDNAPFSFHRDGELVGIDVDLARLLAKHLDVRADWMEIGADENVDDDLRNAVWKGHYLGGGVADVMMSVPYDPLFAQRNPQVVLFAPYFRQEFVAVRREGDTAGGFTPAFAATPLAGKRIGVEIDSLPDFFFTTVGGGRLREDVVHFPTPQATLDALLAGRVATASATRSQAESILASRRTGFAVTPLAMPGFGKSTWTIGVAVKENARDLGWSIEDVVTGLIADGGMAEIFRAYGVNYAPPPDR